MKKNNTNIKYRFNLITLIWFVFLGATSLLYCPAYAQESSPNVVMIVLDDLNDYIGALEGHPQALTPNIDTLASQGVLFTNAHSNSPLCKPSRASFLTGLLPKTTQFFGNVSGNNWRNNLLPSTTP